MSKHKEPKVFCLNCLSHFPNKKKLSIHEEYCWNNEAIKNEMPEEGSFISFIHHNRSIKVPFVVYTDFEGFTEEISSCEPNDDKSFTKNTKDTNQVDFAIKLPVLMKNYSIINQFSIGQKKKMKISAQYSLKCLRRISSGFIKNSTFQKG